MSLPLDLDAQIFWEIGYATQGTTESNVSTLKLGKGYTQRFMNSLIPHKESWTVQIFCRDIWAFNHVDTFLRLTGTGYVIWTDPIEFLKQGIGVPKRWAIDGAWKVTPHSATLIEISLPLVEYTN
jgi:phage-related protein